MIKRIKCGRLYRFHNNFVNIDRFFWYRVFRKLGFVYIPLTLRFYDELYLREDYTKWGRALVEYCKKRGIRTYTVEEGGAEYFEKWMYTGQSLLHADYFICSEQNKKFWLSKGIGINKIRTFKIEKKLTGIVFLSDFVTYHERIYRPEYYKNWNSHILKVIETYIEKPVVFKLHPNCQGQDILRKIIPSHRIVSGEAEDLILQYDTIYCFKNSTIRTDCEMLNKEYQVVEG